MERIHGNVENGLPAAGQGKKGAKEEGGKERISRGCLSSNHILLGRREPLETKEKERREMKEVKGSEEKEERHAAN